MHDTTTAMRCPPGTRIREDDRLREECGVFGVFGNDSAALTALGLHALQHRGQEAAGIVTYDGQRFHSERRLGLVGDNFNKVDVIGRCTGASRSATSATPPPATPSCATCSRCSPISTPAASRVAHNGNLTNALTLREDLISSGAICQSTSDTEVILHLIARSQRRRIVERFIEALRQIQGAYALVCLTNDMLIGARDPIGIRPLVLGELGRQPTCWRPRPARSTSSAPSSCARSRTARSSSSPPTASRAIALPAPPRAPCIFEYIYFARPDSHRGRPQRLRYPQADGRAARHGGAGDADVIIPVPELRRAGGHRLRPAERHSLRARHHPQPLRRPHLHRARAAHPPARRQAQALGQPAP